MNILLYSHLSTLNSACATSLCCTPLKTVWHESCRPTSIHPSYSWLSLSCMSFITSNFSANARHWYKTVLMLGCCLQCCRKNKTIFSPKHGIFYGNCESEDITLRSEIRWRMNKTQEKIEKWEISDVDDKCTFAPDASRYITLSAQGSSLDVRIWRLQTSASDVHRRQNLTFTDVRLCRLKTGAALKELNCYNDRRPITCVFKWSGKS